MPRVMFHLRPEVKTPPRGLPHGGTTGGHHAGARSWESCSNGVAAVATGSRFTGTPVATSATPESARMCLAATPRGGKPALTARAAVALYALDHHIERLAEDHANAKRLADGLAQIPFITLMPIPVETNILLFDIDPAWGTAAAFSAVLKEHGVLINATAPQRLRAVTHLDVTASHVDKALAVLYHVAKEHRGVFAGGEIAEWGNAIVVPLSEGRACRFRPTRT